jgi:hypothetical protein
MQGGVLQMLSHAEPLVLDGRVPPSAENQRSGWNPI